MAAFSAFYDDLMPELPGCTTALVDQHLLRVAREFCEESSAWRVSLIVPSVAAEPTYDISAPEADSEVVRVIRVTVGDLLLWDAAWRPQPAATANTATAEPRYPRSNPPFSMNADNTELTFIADEVPTETAGDGLDLIVAAKPGIAATVIPDFMKAQHLEAMRAGVLARLMRMAKKPWTDRELSGFYDREYQRLKGAAAHNAQMGNTGARLRTSKTRI
ncbi:hypothetical protein [Ramlibacter sp.]|uniref:hypothetical protein n=1 Tax=Ramlibacter sp. TaxID=1917967 RepID=UPI003D0B8FBA